MVFVCAGLVFKCKPAEAMETGVSFYFDGQEVKPNGQFLGNYLPGQVFKFTISKAESPLKSVDFFIADAYPEEIFSESFDENVNTRDFSREFSKVITAAYVVCPL